jgi:ubiquinone/menaquinone biosynthesis C-methylase UbiE
MTADPHTTVARYRRQAAGYDASAQRTMRLRLRTIERLALRPGDVVLDAGCGTGLSFPGILCAISADGALYGVELSPHMLQLARERVATAGWRNVTLIEGAMQNAQLPRAVDAVLFNYTHDLLRSPAVLDNVFRHARPGARVAAAGIKHPPRWLDPFRLYRRFKSRACYGSPEGLDAPWSLLARYVPQLQVTSTLLGTGYIAWGRYAPGNIPSV